MRSRWLLGAVVALGALCVVPLASDGQVPDPNMTTIYGSHPWDMGTPEVQRGIGEFKGRAALPGKSRLLIVQPRGTSQVYLVGRTRYFDSAGKPTSGAALHEGDEVRVDFDIVGNTAIAKRVDIVQPPAPVP